MGFFRAFKNLAKSSMGDTKAMIEQGHWMMKNGQIDAAINCYSGAAIKGEPEAMLHWGSSLIDYGNSDIDTFAGLTQIYKAGIHYSGYQSTINNVFENYKVQALVQLDEDTLENIKAGALSNPYRAPDESDKRSADMVLKMILEKK